MLREEPVSQISLNEWTDSQPAAVTSTGDAFRAACAQALQALDLPAGYAAWQRNKTAQVLKLGSQPVASLTESRDGWRVQIRTGRIAAERAGLLTDPVSDLIPVSLIPTEQLAGMLSVFFEQVIDQGNNDRFACCSLYRQCSAAGACVQADRLLALSCAYRLNLKRGRVYFG